MRNRSCPEARRDKVMNRVDAHARQRVDLLGNAHRSEFRRQRASDSPGEHRRRENGAQLLHQRQVDRRADAGFESDQLELRVRLHRENHPDKRSGQHNDRQTQHADVEKRRRQRFSLRALDDEPKNRRGRKNRQISRQRDATGDRATDSRRRLDEPFPTRRFFPF